MRTCVSTAWRGRYFSRWSYSFTTNCICGTFREKEMAPAVSLRRSHNRFNAIEAQWLPQWHYTAVSIDTAVPLCGTCTIIGIISSTTYSLKGPDNLFSQSAFFFKADCFQYGNYIYFVKAQFWLSLRERFLHFFLLFSMVLNRRSSFGN